MTTADENLEQHRFDVNDRNTSLLNATQAHRNSNLEMEMLDNEHEINMNMDMMNACGDGLDQDIDMNNNDLGSSSSTQVVVQQPQQMYDFDKKFDNPSMRHSLADITALIADSPSDYSYFNFDKIKLTDLPRHLKRMAQQIHAEESNNGNIQQPVNIFKIINLLIFFLYIPNAIYCHLVLYVLINPS